MIETLTGITPFHLVTIGAIVFVAGFVRGLTGVGLAVVLVPLVNIVFPPERTVCSLSSSGALPGQWDIAPLGALWIDRRWPSLAVSELL